MLNKEGGSKQIRLLPPEVSSSFFAFLPSSPPSFEQCLGISSTAMTQGKERAGEIPDSSASNIADASETSTTQSLTNTGIKKASAFRILYRPIPTQFHAALSCDGKSKEGACESSHFIKPLERSTGAGYHSRQTQVLVILHRGVSQKESRHLASLWVLFLLLPSSALFFI